MGHLRCAGPIGAALVALMCAGCSDDASPTASGETAGKQQTGTIAGHDDQVVEVSALPAAVVAAVDQAAPGSAILSAEFEDAGAELGYEVHASTTAGAILEITVTQGGTVLKVEADDSDGSEAETDDDDCQDGAQEGGRGRGRGHAGADAVGDRGCDD
jgi:hypothetical protein